MNISRECIPCLARQAVEIAEEATADVDKQEAIIKRSLATLSQLDFRETAPEIAFRMHQHAKELTGNVDPYLKLKAEYNQIAATIAKRIREERWLETASDPFDMACRLAISGNIIDFSVGLELEFKDVLKSVENSLKNNVFGTGSKALLQAVESANRIMYLADNAGEIIFDKFLLEHLPLDRVTYVVKGGPIVNDATMDDAVQTGVADLVKVMDNGHASQGIVLEHCSDSFIEAFEESDLIISKGQANFETLSHLKGKNIFYLLRAKCKSVAREIGCEKMDYVLSNL
jgi:hypothetical protein